LAETGTAQHLERLVRGEPAGLVAGELRHRRALRRREAVLALERRPVEQQLRLLEPHPHVGELPLQALELAQGAAELPACERMLARQVEGVPAEREGTRRVPEALDVEAGDLLLEAAGSQQDVGDRDTRVLEVERRPLLAVHEPARLADREARGAALDQHRADAVHAGAEADVDQEKRRVRTVRREDLAAIDDDLVAAALGGRAQLRHRGAGLRLSHAQRDHASAAQQVRQVALLLLGRRVLDEGPDRAEITGLYDVGAARAYRRDLLDRQDRMHQGPAL